MKKGKLGELIAKAFLIKKKLHHYPIKLFFKRRRN